MGHPPARRSADVTGIGVVTSLGCNAAELLQSLRDRRSGFRVRDVDGVVRVGAFVDEAAVLAAIRSEDDELSARAFKLVRRAPIGLQASVACALEAWRQARLDVRDVPPERVALVVGGQNLNASLAYTAGELYRQRRHHVSPLYALEHMDSDHVGALGDILGIQGEGFTVGAASASGNAALLQGLRSIRSGASDICVVVGAMTTLSPLEWHAYEAVGAMVVRPSLAPEEICRPFDTDHRGFVYGQGCGCIILEARDASSGGPPRLAEFLGGAAGLDAHRSPAPSLPGEVRALLRAIADAAIDPAEIDYVNAHGTSSAVGDEIEAQAIAEIFGPRVGDVWVNSSKGWFGHCLTSAGVVEAIATILQMRAGWLHPNANLVRPVHDRLRFVGPSGQSVWVRAALSGSFGFGGISSGIVLKDAHAAAL